MKPCAYSAARSVQGYEQSQAAARIEGNMSKLVPEAQEFIAKLLHPRVHPCTACIELHREHAAAKCSHCRISAANVSFSLVMLRSDADAFQFLVACAMQALLHPWVLGNTSEQIHNLDQEVSAVPCAARGTCAS